MAGGFVPFEKTCVICGKKFWAMNPRAAKRKYCDYSGPCRRKWNLMRERQRGMEQASSASSAQALDADRLAHAKEQMAETLDEYERAYGGFLRCQEMLTALSVMYGRMIRLGIITFDKNSPAWDRRDEFTWAMYMALKWDPTIDPTVPLSPSELKQRLKASEHEYEQATADDELGDVGKRELDRAQRRRDWLREHPEEWAKRCIDDYRKAFKENNPGEDLPENCIEVEWFQREADRRRRELDWRNSILKPQSEQ